MYIFLIFKANNSQWFKAKLLFKYKY